MIDQYRHIHEDQLEAYLDGALEPAASAEIQAHLAACPLCRSAFEQLEDVVLRLEALPEAGLARDLSSLVVARLKAERSLSPGIAWTLVVEALAAAAAIGLLIPAFQAAGWLPRLAELRLILQAAANTFLAQLSSSWLAWWAGLKLQVSPLLASINPPEALSPWVLVGAAGGLAVLINAFLLRGQTLPNGNHPGSQP